MDGFSRFEELKKKLTYYSPTLIQNEPGRVYSNVGDWISPTDSQISSIMEGVNKDSAGDIYDEEERRKRYTKLISQLEALGQRKQWSSLADLVGNEEGVRSLLGGRPAKHDAFKGTGRKPGFGVGEINGQLVYYPQGQDAMLSGFNPRFLPTGKATPQGAQQTGYVGGLIAPLRAVNLGQKAQEQQAIRDARKQQKFEAGLKMQQERAKAEADQKTLIAAQKWQAEQEDKANSVEIQQGAINTLVNDYLNDNVKYGTGQYGAIDWGATLKIYGISPKYQAEALGALAKIDQDKKPTGYGKSFGFEDKKKPITKKLNPVDYYVNLAPVQSQQSYAPTEPPQKNITPAASPTQQEAPSQPTNKGMWSGTINAINRINKALDNSGLNQEEKKDLSKKIREAKNKHFPNAESFISIMQITDPDAQRYIRENW